jgi:protease I
MDQKRIVFLLGEGFEDSEFQVPFDGLKKAGFEIDIVGAKAGEAVKGYKKKTPVKITKGIADAKVDDYVALVIPGGQSPDHLRVDPRFADFVCDFNTTGRPLAAVCHGPQLLMAAGIVKGRTLTAWPTIQADLKLIDGVNVKDEEVVVDGNWITSRKPDDLSAFTAKILEEIEELTVRDSRPSPRAAEETRSGQVGAAASDKIIDPEMAPPSEPERSPQADEHVPYVEH